MGAGSAEAKAYDSFEARMKQLEQDIIPGVVDCCIRSHDGGTISKTHSLQQRKKVQFEVDTDIKSSQY